MSGDQTTVLPAEEAGELGRQVARGLRWSFMGTTVFKAGGFLSGLIMARLLVPEDFGVYTVGAAALMITASVNDVGIEASIVRWPGEVREVLSTAFTVVMTISVAIFAAFWLAAPAFCDLLNAPDGVGVVRLMSVGLLISGAFTRNSALTTRHFRQHVRTMAEATAMVTQIAITVVLAKAGYGAWSLAWGHIVGNLIVGGWMFVASPAHARPGFDPAVARILVREGLPLAGTGLLAVAILNVDYLVVGSTLGAGPLGVYLLAFNIASWPISIVSAAVNRVSVAGFARLQGDQAALDDALARSLTWLLAATMPLCVLLAGLSLPVVRTLYGSQWSEAATPLHFLAVLTLIRVPALLLSDALVATGRGKAAFTMQFLWLAALVPALFIGAHVGGLAGVGTAHLGVALVVVMPAYLFALNKAGFALGRVLRAPAWPAVGSLCVLVVLAAAALLPGSDLARLIVVGTVGICCYLVVVRPIWLPVLEARRARLATLP